MAKTIKIQLKTKRGKYIELAVPAVNVVCPNCEGFDGCGFCDYNRVCLVRDESILTQYPKLYKAIARYELESERNAWEAYGERVWGA